MSDAPFSSPPLWNIVSLVLPVAAIVLGVLVTAASGRSDMASGLGSIFKVVVIVGAVSMLGEAAAVAALIRGERMVALSVLGIVLNLLLIVPAVYLWSRMD